MSASEVKIFLAEKRGRTESVSHRSLHTFNFGNFADVNRQAFFDLNGLNDETLMAGKQVAYSVADDRLIFLLPLVGGVQIKVDNHDVFVEAGEAQIILAKKSSTLQIRNPYEIEPVNYLVVWLFCEAEKTSLEKLQFDLEASRNSLARIISPHNVKIHLGTFGGRIKKEFTPQQNARGLFAFVIEGAMEIDNRLIQQRDGLAIANKEKIEFESLAEETILLLIEL